MLFKQNYIIGVHCGASWYNMVHRGAPRCRSVVWVTGLYCRIKTYTRFHCAHGLLHCPDCIDLCSHQQTWKSRPSSPGSLICHCPSLIKCAQLLHFHCMKVKYCCVSVAANCCASDEMGYPYQDKQPFLCGVPVHCLRAGIYLSHHNNMV